MHPAKRIAGLLSIYCVLLNLFPSRAADSPRIQGTFLQLLNSHFDWQPDKWVQLFDYFRQLGISELVIQWTVSDQTAFFTSPTLSGGTPFEKSLELCDKHRIKVYAGLVRDPAYWAKIGQDSALAKSYLRKAIVQSEAASNQLIAIVQKHPSFAGWYITEEIDDVNWVEPQKRQVLFEYLHDLSAHLHKLAPSGKVALSGFSNANLDPKSLEKFWEELLKQSSVDVVMFQDGIGAGKLQIDYLGLYLAAIKKATDAQSRELQIVVETFRQVGEKPFAAVPASLDRIKRQMDVAGRYSSKIVAFSVPEYMTPLAGQDAEHLFRDYLSSFPVSR
ncbi:MAG TPA: DUF4434 domain-containing protein [Acidobacteriota bacterium]